ncbi:8-oxoguanine deaminase [Tetrabaena socialis]|uniref:8-oxoguanine deaminase n=1 Tax=Tetrabaena socialis TaxID=47790 RepID=A0A2J8ABW9_9CHLO|nr:8-oxoguanine deaminase [Tetrabaena socialis]|eukprot:PNH10028.1 8-oxoguanine deaminase [Tetrabaena socialis]
MLDEGVNVGLGVDGAASSDAQSILAEARLAVLLQRAGGDPKGLGVRESLRMATRGGAANLGRSDEIGQLAPGFAADIVGFKLKGNLAFVGTDADPVAALLLCAPAAGSVAWSIIDGHVVVREGALVAADGGGAFDLAALVAQAEEHARVLLAGVSEEAVGRR